MKPQEVEHALLVDGEVAAGQEAKEEASRFAPLERLALSPQCGFATSVGGNQVTLGYERAKLRTIAETAAGIWGAR